MYKSSSLNIASEALDHLLDWYALLILDVSKAAKKIMKVV